MLYECLKKLSNISAAQLMGSIYFNIVQVSVGFYYLNAKNLTEKCSICNTSIIAISMGILIFVEKLVAEHCATKNNIIARTKGNINYNGLRCMFRI